MLAMTTPPASLASAYAAAEGVVSQRSRTFRLASALLPKHQRQAMRVAYAFFRLADDLVDREQGSPAQLRAWREEALRPAAEQTDPILAAWADVRERYAVNPRHVEELLTGIEMDLARQRYETLAELQDYAYYVASTVGLLTLPILGLHPRVSFEQATPYAARLGVALQMTNILTDVGEDLQQGQIYLPRQELAAFGLTYADIEARHVDQRFKRLMEHLIQFTRKIYADAWPGIGMLAGPGRWAVGLGAVFYRSLLDEIRRLDYDVFSRQVDMPPLRKVAVLLRFWPAVIWPQSRSPVP